MAKAKNPRKSPKGSKGGASLGFEAQLWAAADAESRTLTELRDTILPKLISGELRVKDAERTVEGVV